MTDPPDLDSGPVISHEVFEASLHLRVIAAYFHIDEINDNETGKVAKAQLSGDFLSRF